MQEILSIVDYVLVTGMPIHKCAFEEEEVIAIRNTFKEAVRSRQTLEWRRPWIRNN